MGDVGVIDHWHFTGKNRGDALVECNLKTGQPFPSFLFVAFHNLSEFDEHSFFIELIKQKQTTITLVLSLILMKSMRQLRMIV